MNFKEIFFLYYIVWIWMLFLVILYLFEHFKVKIIAVYNKSLVSAFHNKNSYLLKIVSLKNKVVTFFRWDISCFVLFNVILVI